MLRLACLILGLTTAMPAWAASGCEDIWFTRNLVMDRAGYCFTSRLGKALFDNSNCTGRHVILDAPSQALVDRIRALEATHDCRVNTSRRRLDLPDMHYRRVLSVLPIRDEFESACLGWTGPATPLYTGYYQPFHTIGQVTAGDVVSYAHLSDAPGWAYVTTHLRGSQAIRSAGWLYWPGEPPCADFAG